MKRAHIAPPPFLPTSRVVDSSKILASHRLGFSPSSGTCPDIFRPRLELLIFPEGWRPTRVGFSPKPWRLFGDFLPTPTVVGCACYPSGIFTKPWRQSGRFLLTPRAVDFYPRLTAYQRDFSLRTGGFPMGFSQNHGDPAKAYPVDGVCVCNFWHVGGKITSQSRQLGRMPSLGGDPHSADCAAVPV